MPVIASFYGITIKMNWGDKGQHNLPHFHAYYAEFEATFNLNGERLAGDFPPKQEALIKAWTILHEQELKNDWELAVRYKQIIKISPLV